MIPMTKIPGAPDRAGVIPGMAHFAGTGPTGKTCAGCAHFREPKCSKFERLTGKVGANIYGDCAACKYFDENPAARPRFDK